MARGAVPIVQVGADRELAVGINVGDEGGDIRRGGALRPETQEAVLLDVGNRDNVDDTARALRTISCRGVGDDLYFLDVAGGHLLQKEFQRLGIHIGGFVVEPDFHGGNPSQTYIALHVHFHTRCILQGVGCCACLDSRVFRYIVKGLLPVRHIYGLLGGDNFSNMKLQSYIIFPKYM